MSVNNRDLGTGLQREVYQTLIGTGASSLIATGTTYAVCIVPFISQLATGAINGFGLSASPTVALDVTRYNSAGVTTITGMISTYTVVGATLAVGFTVSSGASLVQLQPYDIISLRTATASTAMTSCTLTLVLQALQDIKTHFGV